MTQIKPMTAEMAVTIAQQMYKMLYGLDVDEKLFLTMVAPEIFGAAKMENKATLEIITKGRHAGYDDVVEAIASRYPAPPESTTPTEAQPESLPEEEKLVELVIAAEPTTLL